MSSLKAERKDVEMTLHGRNFILAANEDKHDPTSSGYKRKTIVKGIWMGEDRERGARDRACNTARVSGFQRRGARVPARWGRPSVTLRKMENG